MIAHVHPSIKSVHTPHAVLLAEVKSTVGYPPSQVPSHAYSMGEASTHPGAYGRVQNGTRAAADVSQERESVSPDKSSHGDASSVSVRT